MRIHHGNYSAVFLRLLDQNELILTLTGPKQILKNNDDKVGPPPVRPSGGSGGRSPREEKKEGMSFPTGWGRGRGLYELERTIPGKNKKTIT